MSSSVGIGEIGKFYKSVRNAQRVQRNFREAIALRAQELTDSLPSEEMEEFGRKRFTQAARAVELMGEADEIPMGTISRQVITPPLSKLDLIEVLIPAGRFVLTGKSAPYVYDREFYLHAVPEGAPLKPDTMPHERPNPIGHIASLGWFDGDFDATCVAELDIEASKFEAIYADTGLPPIDVDEALPSH